MCVGSPAATLTHCTWVDNLVEGMDCEGGGLRSFYSNPTIEQCTFYANAGDTGGGICVVSESSEGAPLIERTIVAFGSEGEGVSVADCPAIEIYCSDFYGNAGDCIDRAALGTESVCRRGEQRREECRSTWHPLLGNLGRQVPTFLTPSFRPFVR